MPDASSWYSVYDLENSDFTDVRQSDFKQCIFFNLMQFTLHILLTRPDIHEFDLIDDGNLGPDIQGWMMTVIYFAVLITIFLTFVGKTIKGDKWKPISYVWYGIGIFIALLQVIVLYVTFSKNIFPPVIIVCGCAFWIMVMTSKSPKNQMVSRKRNLLGRDFVTFGNILSSKHPRRQNLLSESVSMDQQRPKLSSDGEAPPKNYRVFRPKFGKIIEGPFGIKLLGIEPGTYYMGSPSLEVGHQSNEDLVEVNISKGFWMARTQCTQEQFQSVMGTNPSRFVDPYRPVERVTWEEANKFCEILTGFQHEAGVLPLEARWCLPSEAQWEYACRAGSCTALNSGKSIKCNKGTCSNVDALAWYAGNSGGMTQQVAMKQPNSWGLFDMHGNVWEWCSDWYHQSLIGGIDPCNQLKNKHRSIRGGGWGDLPWACRSAARHSNPLPRDSDFGFRPIICW